MVLQTYGLDRQAQKLVGKYLGEGVLNESHKMRVTVAYGLERFWGEYLRHGLDTPEGRYWKAVWDCLVDILEPANIHLPLGNVVLAAAPRNESKDAKERRERRNAELVNAAASQLWMFAQERPSDQRIALAVLTQLCDCIVWWTQRYKD